MRIVADFHIHSKYARATSKFMVPEEIAKWAKIKGINVIGTGDCTHPLWVKELKEKLEPAEEGLYRIKNNELCSMGDEVRLTPRSFADAQDDKKSVQDGILDPESSVSGSPMSERSASDSRMTAGVFEPRFIITGEISSIYKQGGKARRVHTLFFVPSFEVLDKINAQLEKLGNIHSDGRPILGVSAKDLAKIFLEASEDCVVVPAHIWTPWFSMLGSKSGFDSIEECYEEMAPYIYAVETGLSSDPPMNWRVKNLDRVTLISNSDAHSPANLMREANVFDTVSFEPGGLSFRGICQAIKTKKGFEYTVEFYPEEGKYHWDGNRQKRIYLSPEETQSLRLKNPSLMKAMTIGVEHRVFDLANRPSYTLNSVKEISGEKFISGEPVKPPEWGLPYVNLVPLQEIIAEAMTVGKNSKRVQEEYFKIVQAAGSEFSVLIDKNFEELEKVAGKRVAEGIIRAREGKVRVKPGYDGVYGEVKVFEEEKPDRKDFVRQVRLF